MSRDKSILSLKILDNENFLNLTKQAQLLYVHLNARADDEGFVQNADGIMRNVMIGKKHLRELERARYIIIVDNIPVIKHWGMINKMRKDRIKPTIYQKQKEKLLVKEDGSYTEKKDEKKTDKCLANDGQMTDKRQTNDGQMSDKCQTNDGQMSAQKQIQKQIQKQSNSSNNDYINYNAIEEPEAGIRSSSSGDRDCINLFRGYGKTASEYDLNAYWEMSMSTPADLLEKAFEIAHESGHTCQWSYIRGILSNFSEYGYQSADDVTAAEAMRDLAKMNLI